MIQNRQYTRIGRKPGYEVLAFPGLSCQLGEGLIWHSQASRLLLVDILEKLVIEAQLNNDRHVKSQMPEAIGWIIPTANDDLYAVGMKSGIGRFDAESGAFAGWENKDFPGNPDTRLNDACADVFGRIWYGSMSDGVSSERLGCLASYAPEEGVIVHDTGFVVTNGPVLSPCQRYLYFSDTLSGTIFRYKMSQRQPSLSGRQVFIQFPSGSGFPDGMCFDGQGNLWVAVWGGARIAQFDQRGRLLRSIAMPAYNITNVCFFGDDLNRLAVSSAVGGGALPSGEDRGGQLFEVKGDFGVGAPVHRCRLANI
jgi:D-xylonolactonase